MNPKKEKEQFFSALPIFLQSEKEEIEHPNSISSELSALDFFASKEKREEDDFERMKLLYPKSAQPLLSLIEDICDKMEYKGSMMYDEYPDKISIQKICDLYCKDFYCKGENDKACSSTDFFQILLLQEMCHRRCRYRRRCELFRQS